MTDPQPSPYDILIAGAGPVGLFLACELRLGGCSVLVLEQADQPHSPLKELPFGLRGLTMPTIDSLDRRDLLSALRARSARPGATTSAHWMQQKRAPAGHFAGIPFFHDQVDRSRWRYRLPEPASSIAVDKASIEAVLAERAIAMGVQIRRGYAVEAVEPSEHQVVVRAGGETFTGQWLVGCDGGRSVVRKAAAIGFSGTEPEFTGYSAQLSLADPTSLKPGRHYTPTGMYTFAAPGTIAMVDFDGGAFHRAQPTREHIEAVLRKISGIEVAVTALELATTWTDRAFQAAKYRRGRILLAGDAAHIHSPLGGQGLNLGLGDAMNLGWKLASTIRCDAPDGLLDSYAGERMPVAAQILDWSRAQVAVMRPSASSRALAAIIGDLVETSDGASYFAERVWGVGLRYDLGGDHPLIGRSSPDFKFVDGTRMNERLRTGRGLLLDFDACANRAEFARHCGRQLDYLGFDAVDRLGLSALLVRPDGVVAWAADCVDDALPDRAACWW